MKHTKDTTAVLDLSQKRNRFLNLLELVIQENKNRAGNAFLQQVDLVWVMRRPLVELHIFKRRTS